MWVASWVFSSPCSSSAYPHPRWPRTPPRRRSTSSPRASPRTPAPPAPRARRRCTTRSPRCATTSPTRSCRPTSSPRRSTPATRSSAPRRSPAGPASRSAATPYDVPHIYGQTDDDVTFGAGYAIAEDRNLLLNQARFDSLTAAIDAPGLSAIDLVSNLYQFAPSKQTERIVSRQSRVLRKAGPKGVQLLHDIDTYLAGINTWYSANQPERAAVHPQRHLRPQRAQGPVPRPGRRQRGRQCPVPRRPPAQVRLLAGPRRLRGPQGARRPGDRDHAEQAGAVEPPAVARARASCGIKNGSFTSSAPKVGLGVGRPSRDPEPGEQRPRGLGHALDHRPPAVRRRAADLYFFPGLVEEMGLHGPDIDVRGATSAPFPGYMLIGRGRELRLDADLGRRRHHRHLRRDAVRWQQAQVRVQGQVPADAEGLRGHDHQGRREDRRSSSTRPCTAASTATRRRRRARRWRISKRRSSYGKDTLDQLFFQDLTYGRIHSFSDFAKSAAQTPQTFNSFYADASTAGVYTAGLLPIRPNGRRQRPAHRRARQVRVDRLPGGRRATRRARSPTGCWSTGTTSRRRSSRPPTTASATRPCSRARRCCSTTSRGRQQHTLATRRRRHEQGGHPGRPW